MVYFFIKLIVQQCFYTPSPICKLRFNELACFKTSFPQKGSVLKLCFRLIKIHIYSTRTGRFLLFSCRVHTPFFNKLYLARNIQLRLSVFFPIPLFLALGSSLSQADLSPACFGVFGNLSGKLQCFPVCLTYVPKAVCVIVFSISSFSSSGIPLIPTSRNPLMIIPTASSSVSPLAIRYST